MRSIWIVFLCGLAGCMVGPKYSPPENEVSNKWASPPDPSVVAFAQANPAYEWWTVFDDPLLDKYIEQGALYNRDLLTAEANILQARGYRTMAASAFYPHVRLDANGAKTYFSKNGPVFVIGTPSGDATDTPSPVSGLSFVPQIPQIQPLYNFLFDATWEIDLFGKTRHSVAAASANIESAIEARNDLLISILAEIARSYIEVRSFQKSASLTVEKIRILELETQIIAESVQKGLNNQIDLDQLEAELETLKAQLPETIARIYQAIYSLSTLTGEPPEAHLAEMLAERPLPKVPPQIAVGLRSDLLRRRPDVRQAERQLAAATSQVGVAVASFFPRVTLFGDGGLQSLQLKNLFNYSSRTWAFGGGVSLPIFQGGNLVGQLKVSQAVAAAAACQYQQIVFNALEETESSLKAFSEDIKRTAHLTQAVAKNREIVELIQRKYETGMSPLLTLLAIKQQLLRAEELLLEGNTTSLVELITLYKALGGGWEAADEGGVCEAN